MGDRKKSGPAADNDDGRRPILKDKGGCGTVYLFGSQAKGTARADSDIDLCVIAPTASKRNTLALLYLELDCDKPIDILLYTPEEWLHLTADESSFAYKIKESGVCLYGGQQNL